MDKPQLSPDDAEASEKLFQAGDKIEIRPQMAVTPQNGDTRIDMVEVRQAFVGMGKEELMRFANDPFWVKLRWFLFGLFWVLWFGMLFGAVAIIAYAPKCSAPAERDWFEKSPLYLINADQIRDSDGKEIPLDQGLMLMKDHLNSLGIKSILLDLNSENDDDFKVLPKKYGSEESLKKVLSTLRESGIHTFLKIVPNHASIKNPWFTKSAQREDPYESYFVWAKGKDGGPPNNWNTVDTVDGQSAWSLNDERGEYYLHQANSTFADLNFRNPALTDYFSGVYKHWLSIGFCGIHLEKVSLLVEDANLEDEHPSTVNDGKLGERDFLTHSKTSELQESYDIIKKWAAVITNSSGVLSVDRVSGPDVPANLIQRPLSIDTRENSISLEKQLETYIPNVIQMPHQLWALDSTSTQNLSPANIQNINLLFLLLPGTSMISSGLEVGQVKQQILRLPVFKGAPWGSASVEMSSKTLFSTFQKVVELRESPSITHGNTEFIKSNTSVLLITRLKDGNPGYLISLNLDDTDTQEVDLKEAQVKGAVTRISNL
uniref:alpha-glucosidase n=1 Tax=Lygus hesperus TaxID=30085 RepID=A0A0K8SGS7_LYGHE